MKIWILYFTILNIFNLKVQIKVYASGVNPVDAKIRSGGVGGKPKLPYTPGKYFCSQN